MMRKNMRGVGTSTDSLTRGIRHLRVSPLTATPIRNCKHNNTVFDEQMSKLNDMADRISKIDLNETPKPTVEPKPSVSEKSLDRNETPMISTLLLMANEDNKAVPIRAVLDSSSKCHFLTDRCRRRLRLPLTETDCAVGGLGERILGKTVVNFSLYFNNTRVFQIEVFVTDRIFSRTPGVKPSLGEQLDLLTKADPNFYLPASVDLLIGTTVFPILVENGPGLSIGQHCCALQSSLGWMMVGRVPMTESGTKMVRELSPQSHEKPAETSRGTEQSFCNVFPPEYLGSP